MSIITLLQTIMIGKPMFVSKSPSGSGNSF